MRQIQATNNNHTIEPANQNQNKNSFWQNAIVGGNPENNKDADRTNLISKKVAFVGFDDVAAATIFAPLCALPNPGSEKLKMRVGDILDSNMWPSHFIALISITFGFSSGFLMAMIPLWKMIMGWAFYFRALLLVTATRFYATFCVTLNEKLPNFTFGSLPGFLVVWMLGIALVFLVVAAYCHGLGYFQALHAALS
ncbi:unnamed protein product [Camellia sinensis]